MTRLRLGSQFSRRPRLELLEDRRVLSGSPLVAAQSQITQTLIDVVTDVPAAGQTRSPDTPTVEVMVADVPASTGSTKVVKEKLAENRQQHHEIRADHIKESKELRRELKDRTTESKFRTHEARTELRLERHDQRIEVRDKDKKRQADVREKGGGEQLSTTATVYQPKSTKVDVASARKPVTVIHANDQELTPNVASRSMKVIEELRENDVNDQVTTLVSVEQVIVSRAMTRRGEVRTQVKATVGNDQLIPPGTDQAAPPLHEPSPGQSQIARQQVQHDPAKTVTAEAWDQAIGGRQGDLWEIVDWTFAAGGADEYVGRTPFAVAPGSTEISDPALQGAGLMSGEVNLNTAPLDEALRQFLESADQVARALTRALASPGMLPWLLVGLAGAAAIEMYRRRKNTGRCLSAVACLATDSTLSWLPGMPGSFSDEDA